MLVQLTQLDTLLDLAGETIIVSANLESLNRTVQAAKVPDDVAEGTKELSSTSTRISSDLHKLVVDVRNVELRDMFARFRRLVRDTARRLGKLVELRVEGEGISLDKRIAERIHDPIAHQLRNAIAHGIEDEATRVAAGKDPVGKHALPWVAHRSTLSRGPQAQEQKNAYSAMPGASTTLSQRAPPRARKSQPHCS